MRFILLRALSNSLTMLMIVVTSFAIIRLSPGSPFAYDRQLPAASRALLEQRYGLHLPLYRQCLQYITALCHGHLGVSIKYNDRPIEAIVATAFPYTLRLAMGALLVALLWAVGGNLLMLGLPWLFEPICNSINVMGMALPSFVLGPCLIQLFALHWRMLPPAGIFRASGWLLPSLALGLVYGSQLFRLVRAELLRTEASLVVRSALARGLPPLRLFWRYRCRGMWLVLLSYLAPLIAGLLVGSVVTESIFMIPGLGPFFIDAAQNRDYFLVMGLIVVQSSILLLLNFLVEISLPWWDPRLRTNHCL